MIRWKQMTFAATFTSILMAVSALAGSGSAHVDFSVRATMHTVRGGFDVPSLDATMESTGEEPTVSIAAKVAVHELDTGDEKRDKEMYHVLKEDVQPEIRVSITKAPLSAMQSTEAGPGGVSLSIQLAGVTQEIEADVTEYSDSDESLSFTATFIVSQLAFELKPIRKMGFLKVADPVTVVAAFTLEK